MPSVTLARSWIDPNGVPHPAGSTVNVDEATAAQLRLDGFIALPGGSNPGGVKPEGWKGPGSITP